MKTAASFLSSALLVLIGVLFTVASANAAVPGTLKVTLRGSVKSGVVVQISGGELDAPVEQTTARNGKTTFALNPGVYTVTPRKADTSFTPEVWRVGIVAGQTVNMTISSSKNKTKVGSAYCVGCHDSFLSESYASWLKGPHGNFQFVDAAHNDFDYDNFTEAAYPSTQWAYMGFPSTHTIASNQDGATCLPCHGPSVADNQRVARFPLVKPDGTVDPVNATQQSRPVVGCEACHGSGRRHIASPFGRALTYNAPTSVQCGQCHNNDFPANHLRYHPAGAGGSGNPGIYEAYQNSAHVNSVNSHVMSGTTAVRATCSKCHSDQGAQLYKGIDGDRDTLRAVLGSQAPTPGTDAVQCRTCHDSHNPNELLEVATAATATAKARSAEFNTCTNCHQLLDANDAKINPYHNTHAASITNTHYDDPATQAIEGYNVNRTSATACSDCHNPHATDLEVNEQWSESGHGEKTGEAWAHYDWKLTNRQACQRCHSTTGFANYVANPTTYNAANNDFSHLTGLQNETLHCNGCHNDSAFSRRPLETVTFPSGLIVSLGDDSNLCMACHQGRASKKDVDAKISAGQTNATFANIHYLAAAASLFGTEVQGGYEYAGKTYVGRNTFAGHGGFLDTCTKCHMRTDTSAGLSHTFMPELGDCSGCHAGITSFGAIRTAGAPDYDGDGNITEGLEGEIVTLEEKTLTALMLYAKNVRGVAIVYDATTNPYWFKDTNGNGVKDAGETASYNAFNGPLLKAAYNYHTVKKDPGGFIHNHRYMVQLLHDSIQDVGGSVAGLTRP